MKRTLLFLILLLTAWACQKLNSVNPPDEFDVNGQFGRLVDTAFYATDARFTVDYRSDTANGKKLCVGNYADFQAGFFIKFILLPSDTMKIDSLFLEFTSFNKFGTGQDDLNLEVYEVDREWDEHTINTLDEWHNWQPNGQPIYNTVISAADTAKMKIEIDTTLFNKWRYEPDQNFGVYVKAASAQGNHIREFKSLESGNPLDWPKVYYFKNQGDTASVLDSVRTGIDATVFDYPQSSANNVFEEAQANNDLLIASGIPARLFVRFDSLKTLPKTAVIQAANLVLEIDESNTALQNENQSNVFYLRSISKADTALNSFEIDSSFTTDSNFGFDMIISGGAIQMKSAQEQEKFGKNQIQNLINGRKTTEWFYVHFVDAPSLSAVEANDISVYKLFSPNDAEHPEALKLHIRYFEILPGSGL